MRTDGSSSPSGVCRARTMATASTAGRSSLSRRRRSRCSRSPSSGGSSLRAKYEPSASTKRTTWRPIPRSSSTTSSEGQRASERCQGRSRKLGYPVRATRLNVALGNAPSSDSSERYRRDLRGHRTMRLEGERESYRLDCGPVAGVTFEGVGKVYPDGTKAVSGMDLEIQDGEFMVLVGPSGCGKTTALRMVAGLEEISEGLVRIGERVVNHVPARDRDIAMVFQSYALYPHLTVYDNIAFGLRLRKAPKEEIDGRVREAARILGLEPFLERKPRALSGGQRQRVAMGRAIVRQPQAYLMDEPLSKLG